MDTIVPRQRGDERFRALFDRAPMGVALCDIDGRLLEANEAFQQILADTGVDTGDATLLDLLCHTAAEADEQQDWPRALDAVRDGERPVARAQLNLAPVGHPPRLVQVTAARVGFGDRTYLLTHVEDATGRRLTEQRLVYLATHDALTGLANRELVQQRLVAALARSGGSSLPVGVLHIDLDGYEDIAGRLGTGAGEEMLAEIGERLGRVLRAGDSAGRLDGHEFLIVACDVAGETALAELVRRIDATLSVPVQLGVATGTDDVTAAVPVSVNIGAVLSRPGEQAGPLIRRADAARYAVKRASRRQRGRSRAATAYAHTPRRAEPSALVERR